MKTCHRMHSICLCCLVKKLIIFCNKFEAHIPCQSSSSPLLSQCLNVISRRFPMVYCFVHVSVHLMIYLYLLNWNLCLFQDWEILWMLEMPSGYIDAEKLFWIELKILLRKGQCYWTNSGVAVDMRRHVSHVTSYNETCLQRPPNGILLCLLELI